MRADAPEATAVVEDLQAAEAARRREHAALLDELADDAAATARVLAQCSAVVGGTGRPGDEGRAVAHLALALPHWGTAELTARGDELAHRLLGLATPEQREAFAAAAVPYAGTAAFADAFLTGLGADGVALLFTTLGSGLLGPDGSVARILAAAFGAAEPDGSGHDPVAAVVDTVYVREDDRSTTADLTVAGMAAVLAAGAASPFGGPRPSTLVAWSRQLLKREQAVGSGAGAFPDGWAAELHDPAGLAIGLLVGTGESGPAAELLGDRDVWEVLLSRFWRDGGVLLQDLVVQAGAEPGTAGDRAVRAGLDAIGTGLPEGPPGNRTVDRGTVAAVAPALGTAVVAHLEVVTDALMQGVDAEPGDARDTVRGLGYLTVDRGVAARVGQALSDWIHTGAAVATDPTAPAPAVAVPSAYVAAQQYGQRLVHALGGYEAQAEALRRQLAWQWTGGLVEFVPGTIGEVGGFIEGFIAIALGADGTWDYGVDRGLEFDRDMAARESVAALHPQQLAEVYEVARQARLAFDRTTAVLGDPAPPESPPADWRGTLLDAVTPGPSVDRLP
jgi:hypothetical protein